MVIEDKNKPALSVIMTVYNSERYIEKSITSVLGQSFKDYEFIIVDDGSTDNSINIISSIRDNRIHLIKCNHLGRTQALNYAFRQTNAPLIAIMDSDDISSPDRFQKQIDILNNNPGIGIVSSWYEFISGKEKVLNKTRKLPENHDNIEYEMTIHCSMCFSALMLQRRLITQLGGFNEELSCDEDYDLYLKLLPLTKFYNVQEVLLKYRIHSSSNSVMHKIDERTNTFQLSKNYLKSLFLNTSSKIEKREIAFRLGLNDYYHGGMRSARRWFLLAMPLLWRRIYYWRYLLPTFMGDYLFRYFREFISYR
jgi:glycosyltransferase involved in cell wall biosynthesis